MYTSFWKITIIFLFSVFTQLTQAWLLWIFCGEPNKYIIVDGNNVTELLKNPECLASTPPKGTTVFVHGFTGGPNGRLTPGFIATYLSFGGKNVILLDWSAEAAGPAIRYPVAIANTYTVGTEVAYAFSKLFISGLDIASVRVVGLSLGAHLAGRIGAALKLFGWKLPRPFTVGDFPLLSPEDTCSHTRSVDLDKEALFKPYNLIASKATSYEDWVANDGAQIETTVIGEFIDISRRGKYYMSTFCQSEYGKGLDGLRP